MTSFVSRSRSGTLIIALALQCGAAFAQTSAPQAGLRPLDLSTPHSNSAVSSRRGVISSSRDTPEYESPAKPTFSNDGLYLGAVGPKGNLYFYGKQDERVDPATGLTEKPRRSIGIQLQTPLQ